MRFFKYFPLACALVSAVYGAPMIARDSNPVLNTRGRTPSGSHLDITIAFEENPLEGIHTHLTAAYTEAVKEDVRTLVKSIAARELGATVGTALLFTWVGTPSPDTAKPVKYDVSTKNHGKYRVVMSHRTPMADVIVTDVARGKAVRKHGDRELGFILFSRIWTKLCVGDSLQASVEIIM
ncbi:hypothetical protein EV361DRAFT_592061 [Lentinula raphanica]|nr:hypothetical protein EV361DRAFT_592061 [Lentinula raphanica]